MKINKEQKIIKCKCGCGTDIFSFDKLGRARQYANHHHPSWNKGLKGVQIPWNKGIKGLQVAWNKGLKGINLGHPGYMKGKKHSKETKMKMRLVHIGLNTWTTGRKLSPEHIKKISERQKGSKNPRWVQDRTKLQRYSESEKERRSSAYREWRKLVLMRDDYKCKINNTDCSGRLECHHILTWKEYPELRYEKNNGICLCSFHHPRSRKDEIRLSPYFQELLKTN